ncbi:type IV pilus modification protein PilV [Aquabacterium sp.]|uniref:type IV pilus modification protein PilV n=1 Tax=Aquabacterium sp. TaxID=1872578 RepID=UPI0025C3C4BA|nr:type IV pilus modification protein PilV [Aquabacterium sp.]
MRTSGFMLIEVLVALLIFSLGILGLLAGQRQAVQQASAAQYRAIAATQAADLVSKMWLSDRTAATLQAQFASSSQGSGYTTWLSALAASGLPGVSKHPPTVSFTTVAGGTSAASSSLATISIYWQGPGDEAAHQYTATAQLK